MRFPSIIAWLAGVSALAALIFFNNPGTLLGGVAALRWWLIAIVAWHGIPLLIDARAWQLLFGRRPALMPLLGAIWIGEGVNGLFPIPHLGEIARARIARNAAEPGEGAATVVVDLTLGISTELIFTLIGVALLSTLPDRIGIVRFLAPAGALVAASALAFYLLQRAGLFTLAVHIAHRWSEAARRSFAIASAERSMPRCGASTAPWRAASVGAGRLAGWLLGAGETWLVFYGLATDRCRRCDRHRKPGACGADRGLYRSGRAWRAGWRAVPARRRGGLGPDAGLVLALTKRLRK